VSDREARVKFRVSGDDEVARAAGKVKDAWQGAGSSIQGSFRAVGGAVGEAVSGVLSDLGHVATVAASLNFASSISQVQQFEGAIARLGAGSGRSFTELQGSVNALGQSINEMPEATAAWISSVGQLAYSYEGAAAAAKGMAEYAALTGKTFGQVQGLAAALGQSGRVTGDVSEAMGTLVAQARALGTVGGPAALGDMFEHLQGQISELSGADGMGKIGAMLAGFGGPKGFTPQQRERGLSSVMGKIEGDTLGFQRFFGHRITDEYGHVSNMTGLMEELAKNAKKSSYWRQRTEQTFGPEATAMLMKTNWAAMREAEKLTPSDAAAAALDREKQSPAGQRQAAAVQRSITMQETVGGGSMFNQVQQAVADFAAKHPFLAGAGGAIGAKLASGAVRAGMGALFGSGGGAAAAGAGGTGGAGTVASAGLMAGFAGPALAAAALGGGLIMADRWIYGDIYKAEATSRSAHPVDIEAAKYFGTEYAREHKAVVRHGGMQIFGEANAPQASPGSAGDKAMEALLAESRKQSAIMDMVRASIEAAQKKPVPIEITDKTLGGVDAQRRGEQ
jgi:hypothetical protein